MRSTILSLKPSAQSTRARNARKYVIVNLFNESMLIDGMWSIGLDRCKKAIEEMTLEGPVSSMNRRSVTGLNQASP
jgi:hypothetical protein